MKLKAQVVGDLFVVQTNVISREGSKTMQDRLEKASAYYDLAEQPDRPKHGVPSSEYEELRRRLRNDIQEMW